MLLQLSQMPIGERNTRAGFQIALKGNRAPLVGKFNDHIDRPWTVVGGVRTATGIVLGEASRHVGREASVVLRRNLEVPEDVHEPLEHSRPSSKPLAAKDKARSGSLSDYDEQKKRNGGCHLVEQRDVATSRRSTFARLK